MFGRDIESSKQVWSAEEGYPGDFNYRDFYRDASYDLDYDYVRPYIAPTGSARCTGSSTTGSRARASNSAQGALRPGRGRGALAEHAGNFMFNREHQFEYLNDVLGHEADHRGALRRGALRPLVVRGTGVARVAPAQDRTRPGPVQDCDARASTWRGHPDATRATPHLSSWGTRATARSGSTSTNDWIYPHLHRAALRMIELAKRYPDAEGLRAPRPQPGRA